MTKYARRELKISSPQSRHSQIISISFGLRVLIIICLLFFIWSLAGYLTGVRNFNLAQIKGSSDGSLLASIFNEFFTFYFNPLTLIALIALISPIFIARELIINSTQQIFHDISPRTLREHLNFFAFPFGKTPGIHIRDNHARMSADFIRLKQLGGPAEILLETNQMIIIQDDSNYFSLINSDRNKTFLINLGFGEKLHWIQSHTRILRKENLEFQSFDGTNMKLDHFSISYSIGTEKIPDHEINYQKINKEDALLLMSSTNSDKAFQETITSLLRKSLQKIGNEDLKNKVFNAFITKNSPSPENEVGIFEEEYIHPKRKHNLYQSQPVTSKNGGFQRNRSRRLYSNPSKKANFSIPDLENASTIDRYTLLREHIEDLINPLISPLQIKIIHIEFGEITNAK